MTCNIITPSLLFCFISASTKHQTLSCSASWQSESWRMINSDSCWCLVSFTSSSPGSNASKSVYFPASSKTGLSRVSTAERSRPITAESHGDSDEPVSVCLQLQSAEFSSSNKTPAGKVLQFFFLWCYWMNLDWNKQESDESMTQEVRWF